MPYIKKLKKDSTKRNKTEKDKLRSKLYNLKKWQRLRSGYLIYHPLCEKCLEDNIVTSATDVHHLNSPFDDGLSNEERIGRLLDPNNLMALCKECHGKLHRNKQYFKPL